MSENFNKDTWWDEIQMLKANINKLEQENKELKVALLKFIQLDSHDPDLKDELWCLQQEESPLINPDSAYMQMAEHTAEVIDRFIEEVNDKYGYFVEEEWNTERVVRIEDMQDQAKKLYQQTKQEMDYGIE